MAEAESSSAASARRNASEADMVDAPAATDGGFEAEDDEGWEYEYSTTETEVSIRDSCLELH